jgi:hypothetical protein
VFFNVRGGYKAINRVPILLPRDVFLFDVQRTASSSADVFFVDVRREYARFRFRCTIRTCATSKSRLQYNSFILLLLLIFLLCLIIVHFI